MRRVESAPGVGLVRPASQGAIPLAKPAGLLGGSRSLAKLEIETQQSWATQDFRARRGACPAPGDFDFDLDSPKLGRVQSSPKKLPPLRREHQDINCPPSLAPSTPGTLSPLEASHHLSPIGKHAGGKPSRKLGSRHAVPAPLDHQALKTMTQLETMLSVPFGGSSSSTNNPSPNALSGFSSPPTSLSSLSNPSPNSLQSRSFLSRSKLNPLNTAHRSGCKRPSFESPGSRAECSTLPPGENAKLKQEKAATAIQARYRGWSCRQSYPSLKENHAKHQQPCEVHPASHPVRTALQAELQLPPEINPSQTELRQKCTRMLLGGWKFDQDAEGDTNAASHGGNQNALGLEWSPRHGDEEPLVELPSALPKSPASPSKPVENAGCAFEAIASPVNSDVSAAETASDDSPAMRTHKFSGDYVTIDDDAFSDASGEGWVFESDAGRLLAAACSFPLGQPGASDLQEETEGHPGDDEERLAARCAGNVLFSAYGAF